MGYPLAGRTALVTGANRGIGEAIVDALVAAGVKKVYAAARNISTLDPLVERHGSPAPPHHPALAPPGGGPGSPRTPLPPDGPNPAQVPAAAATANDVDLLVNNA